MCVGDVTGSCQSARPREAWCALLEGTDTCFAPVLDWDEAPVHPHNVARGTFVQVDGVVQPAPAPRFSRTAAQVRESRGEKSAGEMLESWGVCLDTVNALRVSKLPLPPHPS